MTEKEQETINKQVAKWILARDRLNDMIAYATGNVSADISARHFDIDAWMGEHDVVLPIIAYDELQAALSQQAGQAVTLTDAEIEETTQRIARVLLGDVRKVDCDVISSHIRALLAKAAPVAAEPVAWHVTGAEIKSLAMELVRAAESMGDDSDGMTLMLRVPGTVSYDEGNLNEQHVLAVSLVDYPEEGCYPIDPTDPTGGRIDDPPATPPAADARQEDGGALSDEAAEEIVRQTEVSVGMNRAAWDCIDAKEIVRAILSRASSSRAEVPEGYVLVPKEPTDKMMLMGGFSFVGRVPNEQVFQEVRKVWERLLAAAEAAKGDEA